MEQLKSCIGFENKSMRIVVEETQIRLAKSIIIVRFSILELQFNL